MTQVVWDDLLASHTDTPVYTCFCFSTLYWQCILLPQQHVHQHLSGVQWHTKLCLSLGWKQLQRYLLVPQHFVILSLKSCCAVVYCSGLHYAIWSVPCLALSCHIEPPWESAVIMTQDICNSLDSRESCSPLLFSFFFFLMFHYVFFVIFHIGTIEKCILVNVWQYKISLRNFLLAGKQGSRHL